MRRANFWLPSLLVLAGFPGFVAHGSVDRSTKVPFDLYQGYLIVVRGSAGPEKNLNFVLDTGTNVSVIGQKLARKLNLQEQPGVVGSLQLRVGIGRSVAPSLQIGAASRENVPVVIQDLSFFNRVLPVPIDAVVGLDVLGKKAFEIDYRSHQISFGSLPPSGDSLPLRMSGGLPLLAVSFNQTPAHLVLDTGASSLVLFEAKTMAGTSAVQHSSRKVGDFEGRPVRLHAIKVGQAEFKGEPALLVHADGLDAADFDGLLSPALLGITRIGIDVGQGLVVFHR
jgi:predicted aspartyl protease